jgi:hypothetical protein
MLETIIILVFVLWLVGWFGNIGGDLIHLLLVLFVVLVALRLIQGRREL